MPKQKTPPNSVKLSSSEIEYLESRMAGFARRNPSSGIDPTDYRKLYYYLAIQKITYLYDDELLENLIWVDTKETGMGEEGVDVFLIVDLGDEIHLKLFSFKFREKYSGGISTKDLYAFVDRMNRVFLHGDLQSETTLEGFAVVRRAFEEARRANSRARPRIQCYYIVNGQNVSHTDAAKVQEIRDTFAHDRQAYGFTFETYGGPDIYSLCVNGRIPIQDESLDMAYEWSNSSLLHHNIGENPNGMPEQVLVGFVNVNQLIRLVDRYNNNELFEKNVRLFLGSKKEVNRRIIETITGNQSAWFGFMNNGVSITADSVSVELPPSQRKVRVRLRGMQIINGCQTVNALYHAKYDPELKDRFQGNSSVLVRVYQIAPANKAFLDALIIATNSQNAIRPEDLLSNDTIQKTMQTVYHEYGVGYERKEGESLPGHSYAMTFSKEQAAMAYLGVVEGKCSKLRNSLSRREFFREGEDYYRAFDLRGLDSESAAGPLPENFEPNENSNRRCLQILAARCLEESCRAGVAAIQNKKERGSLKKGAYYLARIVYLKRQAEIDKLVSEAAQLERRAVIARDFGAAVTKIGREEFAGAKQLFKETLIAYMDSEGANEDAALKNSTFAQRVDQAAGADSL